MTHVTMTAMDALAELVESLPDGVVATDPATLENYRFAWSRDAGAGTPVAVVRAEDADQVQTAVRWAARHAVPVVPRGAGSGLSGGASAVDGGIVLSLERMCAIEIDAATTLRGIPAAAWSYKLGNRSALEWVLDQYKEKKPKEKRPRT